MYTINLNGAEVHSVINSDARVFKDVKLFAGDNFYPPADASYKKLIWENQGTKSVGWQCFSYVFEVTPGRYKKIIFWTQLTLGDQTSE